MFPEIANIRTRRQKLELKQKEFAEIAKVSQSLIAKLERGRIEPSYSTAKKIFLALDSLEHKGEKKCSDIMTKKVISAKSKDKIEKASELMKEHSIDQLPVFKGRQIIGSISESLIFNKMLNGISKKELFGMRVEKIMAEPFPIVNSKMPLSIALPILKAEDAILVMENRKLVGIITKANLI